MAISNLDYYTPLNTSLTITDPANGLLANDFDAQGTSLSAISFADIGNGNMFQLDNLSHGGTCLTASSRKLFDDSNRFDCKLDWQGNC